MNIFRLLKLYLYDNFTLIFSICKRRGENVVRGEDVVKNDIIDLKFKRLNQIMKFTFLPEEQLGIEVLLYEGDKAYESVESYIEFEDNEIPKLKSKLHKLRKKYADKFDNEKKVEDDTKILLTKSIIEFCPYNRLQIELARDRSRAIHHERYKEVDREADERARREERRFWEELDFRLGDRPRWYSDY